MKPLLAVSTGDPFGVGPEICLKAARDPAVLAACRPLLVGDRAHLLQVARRLPHGAGDAGLPDLHDTATPADPAPVPPGPSAAGGRGAWAAVQAALALARSGRAAALVTAPLSKEALRLAGHDFPGHTEILADACGVPRDAVAMIFVAGPLKVALLSVHLPLRAAIDAVTREAILERLHLIRREHARWFGADPRIGVAALNPHAGEGGMFGGEERAVLAPAIADAVAAGVRASGPFPADTIGVRAGRGEFDVALALYHDQATIAVKARAFGRAVNMTLGLPILRTSVDHGTAYDIAGKGSADHGSLVEAMLLAARLAAAQGAR